MYGKPPPRLQPIRCRWERPPCSGPYTSPAPGCFSLRRRISLAPLNTEDVTSKASQHAYCKDFSLHEMPILALTLGVTNATHLIHPRETTPHPGYLLFLETEGRGKGTCKKSPNARSDPSLGFQDFAVGSSGSGYSTS